MEWEQWKTSDGVTRQTPRQTISSFTNWRRPDAYPDGIAAQFYGDSSFSGFVKNMNADVSNPAIGTQIRISVEGLITH
jgi:hypothetical protein